VRPGEADVPVTDLVLRLTGPWRRLGDEHLPHTDSRGIREWMLMIGIRQLSRMLRPESPSLDVAERLLSLLLNDDRSAVRVVWLTETHYVACDHSYLALESNDNDPHDPFWSVILHCENHRMYALRLWGAARGVRPDPNVLRVLHRLVGLSTVVQYAYVSINEERFPDMLPGIDDFVSMARSRRQVMTLSRVSADTGRALAYNCNPLVTLWAGLSDWTDHGAALIEAMGMNQCPATLRLSKIPARLKRSLAAAISTTSSLEDLDLSVRSLSHDTALFEAIGRNQSIRVLHVDIAEPLSDAKAANDSERSWVSLCRSTSIEAITISAYTSFENRYISEEMRRQSAELVGKHIRSNKRITRLKCSPSTHDEGILAARVAPVLRLNRFRLIVAALSDGLGDGEGAESRVSAVIESPLVRRHPELMYYLLKATLRPS
jgi:hypothetical protein